MRRREVADAALRKGTTLKEPDYHKGPPFSRATSADVSLEDRRKHPEPFGRRTILKMNE